MQTWVFSFQANPQARYSEMSQAAGALGIRIRPQGIEQRLSETAASFMKHVLERVVAQVITSRPAAIPIRQRFRGVSLRDSSVVTLPEESVGVWPGGGGSNGATAALKVQVSFDYSTGQVPGPSLQAGRSQDQASPFQAAEGPAGTLRLADLGFFDLAQFAADDQHGIYWLSRLKVGTAVYDAEGQRLDLIAWLKSHATPVLETTVEVGVHQRLRCRLLAVQVPQKVADRRRQRLKE